MLSPSPTHIPYPQLAYNGFSMSQDSGQNMRPRAETFPINASITSGRLDKQEKYAPHSHYTSTHPSRHDLSFSTTPPSRMSRPKCLHRANMTRRLRGRRRNPQEMGPRRRRNTRQPIYPGIPRAGLRTLGNRDFGHTTTGHGMAGGDESSDTQASSQRRASRKGQARPSVLQARRAAIECRR